MSGRSHPCAGSPAAVLRSTGSVLQLLCSVQHRCFPGAPLKVAQHRGSFFAKVSSDSHVFHSAKGTGRLCCLTYEFKSKSPTILKKKHFCSFLFFLEFSPSMQMPTDSLKGR